MNAVRTLAQAWKIPSVQTQREATNVNAAKRGFEGAMTKVPVKVR